MNLPTFILIGAAFEILTQQPDYSKSPFTAGTSNNPIIVQEKSRGEFEIKPQYPTFDKSPFSPGSFENPIIIRRK
jgi:hypothetical protein